MYLMSMGLLTHDIILHRFLKNMQKRAEQRVPLAELSRCRAAAPAAKLPLERHAHPPGGFYAIGTKFPIA